MASSAWTKDPWKKGLEALDKDQSPKFQEKDKRHFFRVNRAKTKKILMRPKYWPNLGVYQSQRALHWPNYFLSHGTGLAPTEVSNLIDGSGAFIVKAKHDGLAKRLKIEKQIF
jgi:hypothetical protein